MNDKEVAEVIRGGRLSLDEDGTLTLFEGPNGTMGPDIRRVMEFDDLRVAAIAIHGEVQAHEAVIRETWAKLVEELAERSRNARLEAARALLREAGELP